VEVTRSNRVGRAIFSDRIYGWSKRRTIAVGFFDLNLSQEGDERSAAIAGHHRLNLMRTASVTEPPPTLGGGTAIRHAPSSR
jgi:hypothetical protein